MDAQTLFRDGVTAVRERKDKEAARKLLMQSLRLDPENDMAWLWLTRTVDDPQKQIQCLDRALTINPNNQQALEFKKRLAGVTVEPKRKTGTNAAAPVAVPPPKAKPGLKPSQQAKIEALIKEGQKLLDAGDTEGAITQWVYVLEIQPDHDVALKNAIQQLAKLNYMDDVKQLVHQAIDAGSTAPSIYLTAIDIAKRDGDVDAVDSLRDRLVRLPTADEKLTIMMVDDYFKHHEDAKAMAMLEHAIQAHPTSQKLLIRLGDVKKKEGYKREAMVYYDRAAKLGLSSKEGKDADKALSDYAPVITDNERGSVALAWREAVGVGALFLLMGFHDAGLDFGNMAGRWLGVLLAIAGGYLLITATSSPQQRGIAKLLGGKVPDEPQNMDHDDDDGIIHEPTSLPIIPVPVRAVLGTVGAVIMIVAFMNVFNMSLTRWNNPTRPADVMDFCGYTNLVAYNVSFEDAELATWLVNLVGCGG